VRTPPMVQIGVIFTPGESSGTMNIEMPRCLAAVGLVRTASHT
jgi:hypothetical protein